MVILLTVKESENQIISGIPEYVEFETNVPATVFFTLDGTDPTVDSEIAVDQVHLPSHGKIVALKAIAVSGVFYSSILEETYYTTHADLERTRLLDKEGINVLSADGTPVANLTYDADGNPTQESEIPILELDIVTSKVNRIGEENPGRTSKDFIQFAETINKDNSFKTTSLNDISFDPTAKVIVIDGSTQEARDSQVAQVINRPMGTMNPVSDFYNPHIEQHPLVSGSLVRPMYNPSTGKAVFYYMESRENRWIKSIQEVEYKTLNISPSTKTVVFKWVDDRSMSKLLL